LALLAAVCVAGVAVGAPAAINDRWQDFKAPKGIVTAGGTDNVFSRLQAANGNGRYHSGKPPRTRTPPIPGRHRTGDV